MSLKCREEGYKAVVARQETPWCLNTLEEDRSLGEVWDKLYDNYKDIQDDDVFGNANFAINLVDGTEIKNQIIMLL